MERNTIQIIGIILTLTKILISVMGMEVWHIVPTDEQILNITKFDASLSNIVLYHPKLRQERK
jgi:hypothetical protein